MEGFFDMPITEVRTTDLIKILEFQADACTPEYKVKLKKSGRIKVKITKISINVCVKLSVIVRAGIRKNETWSSNGTNYRVVEVNSDHAVLINESVNMSSFKFPDTFVYIGIGYTEGGQP